MTHSQIVKALKDTRFNSEWTLNGDDYESLEWLDTQQAKPTKAEIENAIVNPLPEPELTVQEKLALVGLSVDDLKQALGL